MISSSFLIFLLYLISHYCYNFIIAQQGYSQRYIAQTGVCSRTKVSETLKAANIHGLEWPIADDISNEDLKEILFSKSQNAETSSFVLPDFPYIHKELARSGVTLTLLWNEYCTSCHAAKNTPYMYTQFCEKYRRWAHVTKATMRITHKPGEAMQVDWAGTTIPYFDSVTGIESAAYVFVAILPCSGYIFAEPCVDMKSENWLLCHVHAYNYFGGSTRLLIPDNLKTGVIRNTRYEIALNTSYQELAQHYNTAIVPTRVRKPQDKSAVEGSVKYATTWITAALRNQKFFTLQEIQSALDIKLSELNEHPFQKREGSRRSAFINEEKEFLLPLPTIPYEPAVWKQVTIGRDYLISDGKNKYSVPFNLIGEQVQVRLTRDIVEIYLRGGRVASHPRKAVQQREPIVNVNHMPDQHRKYLNYNADDFTIWAQEIGIATTKIVAHFLQSGTVPEQGYKACASLTKLAERYGKEHLEDACEQVITYATTPNIRLISSLLKNKQVTKSPPKESPKESHAITRGSAYYSKGGGCK